MFFHDQSNLNKHLDPLRNSEESIGLVPTMGALHQGHASLIEQALQENKVVVVSIFVNPTQFNNAEDLKKYPRTLEADRELLAVYGERVWIYAPTPQDLYGQEVRSRQFDFGGLETAMEGAFRPGHFDGVGTVVSLLLKAVGPTKAYFGEKDFQQLQIIRRLTQIDSIDTQIVGCPIARSEKGLALSSRNQRLNQDQLDKALLIYRCLVATQNNFEQQSILMLQEYARTLFASQDDLDLEYFIIADTETLQPATKKTEYTRYRAFIAAHIGGVRLIDNMALN